MSFRVTVMPSGRSFTVEPTESLLEGGLRAGLDLRYNCSTGSCGQCRARVISGEVRPGRFHEYSFGEAEQLQGFVLMCSTLAVSDLVLETEETRDSSDIPQQQLETRIAHLQHPDDEHLLLTLRTPRSRTLRFLAGQYAQLAVAGLPPRYLAVASCPCNGMLLEFHLRREAGVPLIEHLFGHAHIAEPVHLSGPFGDFRLGPDSKRPKVLIGEGVGIAPLKSLVEHAEAQELAAPLEVIWVAGKGGHYLGNYFRSLADALDNFTYTPLVDEAPDYPALRERLAALPAETEYYLSTSPALAGAVHGAVAGPIHTFRMPAG